MIFKCMNLLQNGVFLGTSMTFLASMIKRGNTSTCSRYSHFGTCINNCQLLDIGYKGSRYTWFNHIIKRRDLILEQLDRCFANEHWLSYYLNALVTHLPKTHSNHTPLLLKLSPGTACRKVRRFK